MSGGIFGSLFDFNGDGELDAFEQGMELAAVGLSYNDLLLMDEDERREVLEDVGLDPDDYIF